MALNTRGGKIFASIAFISITVRDTLIVTLIRSHGWRIDLCSF